ncbi:uncharacterized protein LOC113353434 [Papaver somniferum]|nr:uncharacterized protein LOC113353434 [Papaver somniferum]XP_026452822.1 uncharacterized protein LOC113353434 [Papaver somniferum]
MEELKTLTMESPFRSTLKEKITSASALLVDPDEIKKDLAIIRWNEWSIDSVQIHRSGAQQQQSVSSPVEEERRYSIKFVDSAEKTKKQVKAKKKKVSPDSNTPAATTVQVLTDISNLPSAAANLNPSNSKQVQAKKKKIPQDSDMGGKSKKTKSGALDWLFSDLVNC